MAPPTVIGSTTFTELERVKVRDLTPEHSGRRVFRPGAGTVLVGDQPTTVHVCGSWWTLERIAYDIWTATRTEDGHEWTFDPASWADRTLYMGGDDA